MLKYSGEQNRHIPVQLQPDDSTNRYAIMVVVQKNLFVRLKAGVWLRGVISIIPHFKFFRPMRLM
jgi:hypothetical protein